MGGWGGSCLYLVWGAVGGVCLRGGGVTYSCVYVQMGEEFEKGWEGCFGGGGGLPSVRPGDDL